MTILNLPALKFQPAMIPLEEIRADDLFTHFAACPTCTSALNAAVESATASSLCDTGEALNKLLLEAVAVVGAGR